MTRYTVLVRYKNIEFDVLANELDEAQMKALQYAYEHGYDTEDIEIIKEEEILLRKKEDKAKEQSKHTDAYVVYYFCAMWSTGGQNNGHPAGYCMVKDEEHVNFTYSQKELEDFQKKHKTEWLKSAKEIRAMI